MKKILLFIVVLLFAWLSYYVVAICCNGMCYIDGYCFDNTYYPCACNASNSNLYYPGSKLGSCLNCTYSSATKQCSWKPTADLCSAYDEFCNVTLVNNVPSNSECIDRDNTINACTSCPGAQWLTAGEDDVAWSDTYWDYSYGDTTNYECCGDDRNEYIKSYASAFVCCNDVNDIVVLGKCTTPQEICDGIDNNFNGAIDEGFTEDTCQNNCTSSGYVWTGNSANLNCCGDDLLEAGPYQATEINCSDNRDNDCDGFTDCDDPDCAGKIKSAGAVCCWNPASDCSVSKGIPDPNDCGQYYCTASKLCAIEQHPMPSTVCTAGGDCGIFEKCNFDSNGYKCVYNLSHTLCKNKFSCDYECKQVTLGLDYKCEPIPSNGCYYNYTGCVNYYSGDPTKCECNTRKIYCIGAFSGDLGIGGTLCP